MKEPPFLWKAGQKPSIAEVGRVTSLVHDALKKLEKKATEEEIQTTYLVLSSGLRSQLGSDEKSTALAYLYALKGISSWVLQTATKNALKGKAEGLNPTFMPSTADFYRYCEKLENDIRFRANRIIKNLQKPELKGKEQVTPLMTERMEDVQQELEQVLKGVSGTVKHIAF
ncbi:hypothetical protein [Candidatus Bartonella washoeensis]|uniref:hypothetical protein n=1 Tax=Candidatus Bartonella washoeensis TaxID=186739 RepID=UPI0005511DB9|nr:hypothetical protein [Bartonella washoeensis]